MRRAGALLFVFLLFVSGCSERGERERVRRIVYWEKWTSFEGEAMARIVDDFNEKQRARAAAEPGYVPIEVKKVTVTAIEQKLLVAIAGGNPPDVAGIYSYMLAAYADKGALTDLSPYAARAGVRRSDYIEHFYDLGVHRGKLWALPTTPATNALHWNKRLFREAGLDPETPPRTIEELDAFAEKTTKWEVTLPNGEKRIETGYLPDVPPSRKRLVQVGFLPQEPGWWSHGWGYYFGGKLIDGSRVTAASPENVRAFEWVASYSRKLGVDAVKRFRSGFGNFSSPQNPFLSGKIAMQLQGVWMHNFVEKYAPGMQWGAAPFPHPADRPDLAGVNNAEADMLVLPKDARHPEEAFEFIAYVNSREAMEKLCLGQRKFSPFREVSEEFWQAHPHPYIRMFHAVGQSPNAWSAPKIGVWNEYLREMGHGVDLIQNLTLPPELSLREIERRVQTSLDRERAIAERRERKLAREAGATRSAER